MKTGPLVGLLSRQHIPAASCPPRGGVSEDGACFAEGLKECF